MSSSASSSLQNNKVIGVADEPLRILKTSNFHLADMTSNDL